jgi:hypothetical protein
LAPDKAKDEDDYINNLFTDEVEAEEEHEGEKEDVVKEENCCKQHKISNEQ